MDQRKIILAKLREWGIPYDIYEHPAISTVKSAKEHWDKIPGNVQHCKNLFFRNHKGNRHYLVIVDYLQNLAIHDLEQRLKQGKLSFASEERLMTYLGVTPGSVSLFGLLNDANNHVHAFLDKNLQTAEKISFHPNDNTASVVITQAGFLYFLERCGNGYEFIALY